MFGRKRKKLLDDLGDRRGYSPGVKWPGRGVNHTPSRSEVKKRVELYIHSPSRPSWHVIG
jgi:hypothetical protein